jgi:EAL domain-containing protein (putative c-di-GMP-specific phosphodiesterase class I)
VLGLLAPDRFMAILERSPMMSEVGLWVLNAACREARAWREQGLGDLRVAVNLSIVQCRDPRLSDMVLRTLQRHGLPPSALELELTETAAMEDAEHIRRLFGDLRSHGVSVAIDDFGTGYSSLSYLKNLPFSKLKIDREFASDVDRRRDSRAICAALIALARGLGIAVLAEGVETREEMETLREMGCRLFQGFFFAQPMDGPSFAAALHDPAWLDQRLGGGDPSPPARRVAG